MARQTFAEFKAQYELQQENKARVKAQAGQEWTAVIQYLDEFAARNEPFADHAFQLNEQTKELVLDDVSALLTYASHAESETSMATVLFQPFCPGVSPLERPKGKEKSWYVVPEIREGKFMWRVHELNQVLSSEDLADEIVKKLAEFYLARKQ
jgi:hypothetical protein